LADMKFVHSNSIERLVKNKEKEDELLRNNYKFMVHAQTQVAAASQSRSGRCWLFAGLNMLRREMIHHYKLPPNFELSESYLFFYHLYTQFGNLLTLFRTQTLDPHTRADLLTSLIQDGGNFVDFRNLITRYGILPKDHYSETYHSSSPGVMRWVLNNMLRKAILEVEQPNSPLRVDNAHSKQWFRQKMYDCWRLLGVCLGLPPPAHKKFLFRWREFSPAQPIGKESKRKSFTPIELYHSLASAPASVPHADPSLSITPSRYGGGRTPSTSRRTLQMSDMVTLIHDPRNPPGWCTGQFESCKPPESRRWMYNVGANGMDLMKQCVLTSIQNNISVWFACEISENVSAALGGMATGLFDYESVLHTDIKMSKIQRMTLGRNYPNHAMTICTFRAPVHARDHIMTVDSHPPSLSSFPPNNTGGADIDDQGKITKFRVENSWSTHGRHQGYLTMQADWFSEYVFEVVIDKDSIPNHSIRNPPQDMRGVKIYDYYDLFG